MCGGGSGWGWGWLRDSGTIRRTLPLENFTHQPEADLLWWSLRRVSLFPKLWLFKVLQSGQLTAEENMTRHTQRGWEIERRNAPERSWADFLCKLPEREPPPPALVPVPPPPLPQAAFCCLPEGQEWSVNLAPLTGNHCSSWYCMIPLLLPHSFHWMVWFPFFFFFINHFSVITVYTSQRDTILECRRSSLKQNKLKYGACFFSPLAFRRGKLNHSNSIAARGFQCDLKSGILEIGQFKKMQVIWAVDLVKGLCCETTWTSSGF